MIPKIKKVLSYIDEIGFGVSASVLTILTVIAVFMRYVVSNPLMWVEEVQMILIVWSVFFGGSIAFRERGHIAIDLLYERFSPKLKRVIDVIIWVIVAGAICWIGKLQIDRVITMATRNQTTTLLHIPRALVYGVVAFACLLMLINHIICGIEDIQNSRKEVVSNG